MMDDRVKELLLMGSSARSVGKILDNYENSQMYFIETFPEIDPTAVIAYKKEADTLEILDIAVDPDYRGQGLGSIMIKGMITRNCPAKVVAETDDDAVGFYRKLGFSASPFDSKWGIVRYSLELDCANQP